MFCGFRGLPGGGIFPYFLLWGRLGAILGRLGALLGVSWGVLGASWGLLAAKSHQERGGCEF